MLPSESTAMPAIAEAPITGIMLTVPVGVILAMFVGMLSGALPNVDVSDRW